MRCFPDKWLVVLKQNQLPPFGAVEVLRSFATTRSSHSSVLISWSLCSWFLTVKLSLISVYHQKGWEYKPCQVKTTKVSILLKTFFIKPNINDFF